MRDCVYFLIQEFLDLIFSVLNICKNILVSVLLPIIIPIARLLNYIGTSYVRKRNGQVQVPTETYEHPETKERVVLVGVVHVAETSFYEETLKLIDTLEKEFGYIVLYELIKDPQDETPANVKIKSLRSMLVDAKMDISDQFDVLTPRDSWINTDLTKAELFYLLKQVGAEKLFKIIREKIRQTIVNIDTPAEDIENERKELKKLMSKVLKDCFEIDVQMRYLPLIVSAAMIGMEYTDEGKRLKEIILDLRNEIAFAGIMTYLQYAPGVVSVWGAAHLPGIGKMLEGAGFKKIEKYWVSAYTDKNYPLKYLIGRE